MKNNWQENNKIDLCLDSTKLSGNFIAENFQSKIEPLIDFQSTLIDSASKLTNVSIPTIETFNKIDDVIRPISESIQSLGFSLSGISNIALKNDQLLKPPIYDFAVNPMISALNAAADTIKISQNRLAEILPSIELFNTSKIFESTQQINQINSLRTIAVDTLLKSPVYLPITQEEEKIRRMDSKISAIEEKIDKLNDKNRTLAVSEISENIVDLLQSLDPEIAKRFKGAIATLSSESEDLVAQVAESLTRIIEDLPYIISGKEKKATKDRKNEISLILAKYLGVPENEISSNHLIIQQHSYYSTLSTIRHRNADYQTYEKDRFRFKALVIGIESYIYILLTTKNEK